MRWNKPQWWFFNLALFTWQFIMLGIAKAFGHIFPFIYFVWEAPTGPYDFSHTNSKLCWLATIFDAFGDLSWGQIWKASQWCHIRLVIGLDNGNALCISFTSPVAKLEPWSMSTIEHSKGHFIYLDPVFDVSDQEAICLMESAQKKVEQPTARKYDYLQLLSFAVNLPIWIVGTLLGYPCWGLQIIPSLNLPGGREVCSTGATSILKTCVAALKKLFAPFVIAMVSPCMYPINNNWRKAF